MAIRPSVVRFYFLAVLNNQRCGIKGYKWCLQEVQYQVAFVGHLDLGRESRVSLPNNLKSVTFHHEQKYSREYMLHSNVCMSIIFKPTLKT